jgi:hypothetical protein
MWFKKKEVKKKIPWESLLESRGNYELHFVCSVCGAEKTIKTPKRCKPNNKSYSPRLGWYTIRGFNVVDEVTGDFYPVGYCGNCECTEFCLKEQ